MSWIGVEFSEGVLASIWNYIKEKRRIQKNISFFLQQFLEDNETDYLLNADWSNEPKYRLSMKAFVPMGLTKEGEQQEIGLVDMLSQHKRVVVVGGVGSGKSTLTRYMTFQMATALSKSAHKNASQEYLGLPPLVPLRIQLKDCDSKSLEELILGSITDVSPDYIKEKLLKQGKVLLLLDGLDEIVNRNRQREVIKEINKFTPYYAVGDNRFVVTSRSTNDLYTYLGQAGYEPYVLQNLSLDKKHEMADKYYLGWTARESPLGKLDDLKKQLSTDISLKILSDNTFLLSQIIYLHYRGEALPDKRHKLYQKCLEGLIVRKDQFGSVEIRFLLDILGELALLMHQQRKNTVSRDEAVKLLSIIQQQNSHLFATATSVNDLLVNVITRWAIMRAATNREEYEFIHQSLQEYLVARAIANNPDKHREMLKQKLPDSSWQEIIALCVAIRAEVESGTSAIDEILDNLLHESAMPSDELWLKAGFFLSTVPNQDRGKWYSKVLKHLQLISNSDSRLGIEALQILCLIEPNGVRWVVNEQIVRSDEFYRKQVLKKLTNMSQEAVWKLRMEILRQLSEGVIEREANILKDVLKYLS